MKGLLFTLGLTYGGAAVALFNPFFGLLAYIAFAILRPESLWHWSVPPGNYSRIVGIAMICGWILNGMGDWRVGRARYVVWSLVGFMTWCIVSAALAADSAVAWHEVEMKFKIVLPFLIGITLIHSLDQIKKLAWVIVLCQGFVAFEANLSYLGGNNWLRENGLGGLDNNCCAISMVCGVGFAFFLGLSEQRSLLRWLAFFAAALMTHAVMISFSRGGMMALIVTGAVSVWMIRHKREYYGYLLLGALVAIRMTGPSVIERFSTIFAEQEDRDYSTESRLNLWKDCVTLMQRYPFFGVGPHHFPLVATEFGWPPGKEAHSSWLQLGAEMGVPALLFLLSFYILSIRNLSRLAKEAEQSAPEVADGCRMVIASLIGFMVSAQFVSLVGLELPYYVALAGAGYLKLADSTVDDATIADSFETTELAVAVHSA